MGSPRKGNNLSGGRIEEAMQSLGNFEFEYLIISDIRLEPCRGCLACFEWSEERCPVRDDTYGVISASPVYGLAVTGLMKTFIDRFSSIFHRLEDVAGIRGFDVVSRAGLVTPPKMPERQARESDRTAREFFRALAERKDRRSELRSVIIFHGQRATFDELADGFPATTPAGRSRAGSIQEPATTRAPG